MSGQANIDKIIEDIQRDAAAACGVNAAKGTGRNARTYLQGVEDGVRIALRALLARATGRDEVQRISA